MMTNEDREIRNILLNGTEPVPAGAWNAVAKGLDKAAAVSRRRVVWFWGAVGSLAMAAAVAAAVVFIPGHNNTKPGQENGFLANVEVEEAPVVEEEQPVVEEEETVSIENQIAASPSVRVSYAQEIRQEPVQEETVEAVVSGPAVKEPVTVEPVSVEPSKPVSEEPGSQEPKATVKEDPTPTTADPFALLLARDSKAGTKPMAITLGGSALGGSAPQGAKNGGGKMAPAVPTTGIKEEGNDIFGLPLSLGLGVRIPIIPRLSVGTGLNYTMLGRSFTGTYTEASNGIVTKQISSVTISEKLHYVGLPVNIYYDWVSNPRFTATTWVGSSLDLNVGHSYRIPDANGPFTYRKSTHGLQPSLGAGIGLQYNIVPSISLYAEPGVRYYFNAGQPRSIRTVQPWMFGMEIGLRYNLGK